MKSWLPARAFKYVIRHAIWRCIVLQMVCKRLARHAAYQWSWTTMSPKLQAAVAERNAAIRLAMESQTTAYRLQEHVSKLKNMAASRPIERALVELSLELSRLRRLLGNSQNNSWDTARHLEWRQLDAAEANCKRLSLEIDLRRKEIEDIRMSLMKIGTSLDKEPSTGKCGR